MTPAMAMDLASVIFSTATSTPSRDAASLIIFSFVSQRLQPGP